MKLTESDVIDAASSVAPVAFEDYLSDSGFTKKQFEKLTKKSLDDQALQSINDNVDALLYLAQQTSIENMLDDLRLNGGLQDDVFGKQLDKLEDLKRDFQNTTFKLANRKVRANISKVLENNGISELLLVAATGQTIESLAKSISEDLLGSNDKLKDVDDLNISSSNQVIKLFVKHSIEYATNKVSDLIVEQYGANSVALSKVQNYEYDNCRVASGRMTLDAYVQHNIPDLLSK